MQFSPSIYEHAAKLIDRPPWDVSRDPDLLFQAHAAAFERYQHSPVIVGIDIYNLEPEAYGSPIEHPGGTGLPAISTYICENVEEILGLAELNPKKDGRLPIVIETGKKLAEKFPEADIKIPVSGPFSIASNLLGIETLLMNSFMSPNLVEESLKFLVRGQIRFCQEIISHDLGIAFFESSATPPLISPKMFDEIELPALQQMIHNASKIAGHPVPCIIGGDTIPVIESILKTGTKYVICPSETDQEAFIKKIMEHPDIMVRINMDPGIVSSGDLTSIYREIDRVLKLAETREKSCIGTGVLPYETEPAIVNKIQEYIKSKT